MGGKRVFNGGTFRFGARVDSLTGQKLGFSLVVNPSLFRSLKFPVFHSFRHKSGNGCFRMQFGMSNHPLSLTLSTRMKTPQETAVESTTDKANVKPVEAPQGNASKEMTPEEPKATPQYIQIGKMRIDLEAANKALHSASCKAGNLSKVALANGIGRVAKDMSGGGTLIPTVSSLSDMKAKGLLGETDSKEGKAIVQLTIEQVKALNMIVDGFAMFGLCKRS